MESGFYNGANKLGWMSQTMQDDMTAGEQQWGGQTSIRTPAFTAWMVQMKAQLAQFVTSYDAIVQVRHPAFFNPLGQGPTVPVVSTFQPCGLVVA